MRISALLLLVAGTAHSAFGRETEGPKLTHTQTAPAAIEPEEGPKPDVKVAQRRTALNLLVPIPVNFLGGMAVAKVDLAEEQRDYSGKDLESPPPNDARHPNEAAFGAIYLPHAKEGAPRFFAVVARYGNLNLEKSVRPMGEYIIGADIDADDMPFALRFSPSDDASTRVLLRYRQYPGFGRWLPYVGHDIWTRTGWHLALHVPSHVTIGWGTEDKSKVYYAEGRLENRDYPVDLAGERAWYVGYVTQAGLGIRQRIAGPLFLSLMVGTQKETMEVFDESGERLDAYETAFAPFGRIGLETWLDTTRPP